jgi:hypothetical protein
LGNGSKYTGPDVWERSSTPSSCDVPQWTYFCPDTSGHFNFTITFGTDVGQNGVQGKTDYTILVNSTDFSTNMPDPWRGQVDLKLLVSESPRINFTVMYIPYSTITAVSVPLQVYPTQANFTGFILNYQGKGVSSPIHVTVVKGSDYPRALNVSLRVHGEATYRSALDVAPSSDGFSDIDVNATLNCSGRLCTQANGLTLPKNYTLVIKASSGSYVQTKSIDLQLKKAKWLVMLYAEADTIPILEEGILYNVEEMINVSRTVQTPKVGMFVLLKLLEPAPGNYVFTHGGRTETGTFTRPTQTIWGIPSLDANLTQLYQIVDGKLKKVGPTWFSWEDSFLSNYTTLHKFLNTSMTMIPADRNQLIISDHGGGITGIAWDYEGGDRPMNVSSMTRALQGITPKLEVLSFDACLMAQMEVLYNLKDYANYFTASELPVPGYGYAYDRILTQLSQNPSISTKDYLSVIVNTFGERYDGSSPVSGMTIKDNATLSAINASKLEAVKTAMNDLAGALVYDYEGNGLGFNYTMNQIISNSWSADKDYPFVDVYDFASRLAASTGIADTQLKSTARDVMTAVNEAVMANVTDYFTRGLFSRSVRTAAGYHGLTALLWNEVKVEKNVYKDFMKFESGTTFGATTEWPEFVRAHNTSLPKTLLGLVFIVLQHLGEELTLNVYDSAGRHVGLNSSLFLQSREELELQIPGARYFDFHNGTVEIILPANVSSLRVQVDGAYMREAQESFNITCATVQNGTTISSKTVKGSLTRGSVADASVAVQKGLLSVGSFSVTTPTFTPTTSTTTPTVSTTPATTSKSTTTPSTLPQAPNSLSSSLFIPLAAVLVVVVVVVAAVLAVRRRSHKGREAPQVMVPQPRPGPVAQPPPQYQPGVAYQPPPLPPEQPRYKFCTNCGAVVLENQLFCNNCGADVR